MELAAKLRSNLVLKEKKHILKAKTVHDCFAGKMAHLTRYNYYL